MPKSVRTRAHDAVVSVLAAARKRAALTQRDLADRLPAWLEWSYTTVAKVETGRRGMSFVEVREYAKAVGISIATVETGALPLWKRLTGLHSPAARGETRNLCCDAY